jgi:uncharacterized protein (TIGR00299 family) protein
VERLILYLDPWSGVSGDMLLAALLDLDRDGGGLEAALRTAVGALGFDDSLVEVARDVEWGVACTRVRVRDQGEAPLRHLEDMERLLAEAAVSEKVRTAALGAVRRLAEVEAAVHACAVDEIHFHEVGAVDTLVDIVGTFALVEALGVDTVMVGTIPVGGGTVDIAHGRMGVPAPATARLLEGYAVVGGPEMVELTTPTGALLVRQLGATQGPLPRMTAGHVGYGAGSGRLEHGPNVLRVMVGEALDRIDAAAAAPGEDSGRDVVVELQTNLDDVAPEVVAHTMAALREAGAVDVWSVPAHMKKGRPGVVVHALVDPAREDAVADILFRESGTLGVRQYPTSRRLAARGTVSVQMDGVEVAVKWGRWQGRLVSIAAEYEDAARAARLMGIPVKDVMQRAVAEARERLDADGTG